MNNTTIVIPSKFSDVCAPCFASIEAYAPTASKILVKDAKAESPVGWKKIEDFIASRRAGCYGWRVLNAQPGPFCFARNVNLGIKLSPGKNVLICNDDVRFIHPETIEALEYALVKRPDIGIVSPRIEGIVGNPIQRFAEPKSLVYSELRLAFVCVLISQEVIEDIGLLDEQFGNGDYGWDDVDYCLRAKKAGWKLAVNGEAVVKHGSSIKDGSGSFGGARGPGYKDEQSLDLFFQKWGHNDLW